MPVKNQGHDVKPVKKILLVVLLLNMVGFAAGQEAAAKRRDPLTAAETDQLRAAASEPGKRLALCIKFAEGRLLAIDQLRAHAKAAEGRGKKIHDLLEDFTAILDEINDNLDMYAGRPLKEEDRKAFHNGLKEVVEASDKFDLQLRALKSAAETDPQIKKEAVDFQFALQDAVDALKSSADLAHEYLGDEDSNADKK
jgi:hypothetical protein